MTVQIADIQRAAARHYRLTVADLIGPRRTKDIVLPRQIAMYLSRELTQQSLPQIGGRFGGRDHSTVLHAIVRVKDRTGDPEIASSLANIRERLKVRAA